MTVIAPQSPFKITTERVMGSQCTTCKGRGWVTPLITSADGNVSAGDLVKLPCPNPACTVGKEKLGRDQFNKLSRMDKVLGTIKATVSVMPPMTNQYQFSETVTVTNVKAIDILDAVFEAAHQRIDEYQNMAIIMMDIDGNHYSFTSKDRPECGRLTTERKPKEQPKMDTTNLADVFDPAKTDEQVKAALKAAELDLTGSPDEPTSPMVSANPVMMALQQAKDEKEKKTADPIGELKKHLFKLLATQFTDETDAQVAARMKVALKADNFQDFIIKHNPIEKAREYGQAMIDEYLEANPPQRATEPLPSASEAPSRSLPATTNNRVINVDASHLMTGNPQWDTRVMQAQMMISSGLMPEGVDTIEKVLTIGMMGEQLGIPMIVAVNNIDVIKGKPSIKPQLMLALIRRSGQLENLSIEDDGNACTVKMKRKGETEHVSTFSVQDAIRMYLTKNQWVTQPATMRKWRAISAACRVVFPDHIWGFYMPEELDPNVIVVEE